jgi:hypothetical protein
MNITNDIYGQVLNKINETKKESIEDDTNIEFEIVINNNKIDKDQFRSVFHYLKNDEEHYENKTDADNETLDISLDISSNIHKNNRLTIKGRDNILLYCKDNNLNKKISIGIIKQSLSKPIELKEYNVRFNLKSEKLINIEEIPALCEDFNIKSKFFRYKKRYSFETKDKLFRIDLTVVKSSKNNSIRFIDSGILSSNNDKYEIEIELIDFQKENKDICSELFKLLAQILSEIHDTTILIPISKYESVKNEYLKLIESKKNKYTKSEFFGTQPVALEISNILEPETLEKNGLYNVPSILENYTVTEKADGERMLLYVHSDKHIYFINNRLKIIDSGLLISDSNTNTLIDGEYIILDDNNKLFMCFDIYFISKTDITLLPLKGNTDNDRLTKLKSFVKNSIKKDKKNNTEIKVKNFEIASQDKTIFQLANVILKKDYPYHIDGLIFTPANLSVGESLSQNDKKEYFSTWNMVMKWKPPEENTIDFLIKINENIMIMNNNKYKSCLLFVGQNTFQNIDPLAILSNKNNSNQEIKYSAVQFAECILPIDNNFNIITEKNEIIMNNSIIEFAYNNDENLTEELRWIPKRIRHDKTELAKKNQSVTANNINTAKKTMNTIINPINRNIINGENKIEIENINIDNIDIYYNNEGLNRNNSLTLNMLNFHNYIKKNYLYSAFNTYNSYLFEIACGKGGDLNKIFANKYAYVVGIDLSIDNIMNEKNGIYARYRDLKNKSYNSNSNSKMLFLKMDASKKWNKDYISNIEKNDNDPISKEFAEILWGLNKTDNKYLIHFSNMCKNTKFEFVSCQFSIHYFFENEEILNNFIDNIDFILKPGGYFFGCCLDGDLVNKELQKSNKELQKSNKELQKSIIIKGVKKNKESEYLMWQIKKEYDEYSDNFNNNYGKKINVFIETINKEFSEYLVDFQLLKSKLAEKNIILVENSSRLFSDIYKSDNLSDNQKMDEDLQRYSFLNRIWVFQKI